MNQDEKIKELEERIEKLEHPLADCIGCVYPSEPHTCNLKHNE